MTARELAYRDARELRRLNKSLRAISLAVSATHHCYVSHMTIKKWCRDIRPATK